MGEGEKIADAEQGGRMVASSMSLSVMADLGEKEELVAGVECCLAYFGNVA